MRKIKTKENSGKKIKDSKLKRYIHRFRWFFLPLYKFYFLLTVVSRKYVAHTHKMLYYTSLAVSNQDWYDHMIDLYTWVSDREHPKEPHWMERCIYSLMAIKNFKEPVLLELCCGNGFNTKYFYSTSCKSICACDFDKEAISYAEKYNASHNISYQRFDIKEAIPHLDRGGRNFTNVVWDASLIYFNTKELEKIIEEIKVILENSNGILSGMVTAGNHEGDTIRSMFKNKEDVRKLLTPFFGYVNVWEIPYNSRINIYFMASNGPLPFAITKNP